jgi:crotonobetainyl-CoA:carnitine CoA-transferase CaiB-like acyl-CoA transferase
MQFSQTTERLWQAILRAAELEWTLADPVLREGTSSADPKVRVAFWEAALAAVRKKTYDEWLEVFDREPDVWAELYRVGTELLHHPQMEYDRRPVVIDDPSLGPVLQPGPIVAMESTPVDLSQSAPVLDADGDALRQRGSAPKRSGIACDDAPAGPPLQGVTVIELGTFYAAPFGATILADLGARVIKIEQLDGDPMRTIMPFPEVGGIKVLQGKESVAVDMACPDGREIVLELVRRADVVLQTFRAGVADRHAYTAADLLAVNPQLVYLNAPGYGTGGPCGHRPAFAPTIGAGSGLGYRNVGGTENLPQGPELTMEEVKRYSMRLSTAAMAVGHADGFSALGVGTALLVGLLAKRRGGPGQSMSTSMLSTMAHALSEDMVEYSGRPPMAVPDKDLLGLGPLYRLYETADGWVFLAAPEEDDWESLARTLALPTGLRDKPEELARRLSEAFRPRTADDVEAELTAVDVACVKVVAGPVEEVVMLSGGLGRTLGIVTEVTHPVVDRYPRLTPLARLSRSRGVAGPAPLCGQHTDAVLAELGYDQARIAALRDAGVIA